MIFRTLAPLFSILAMAGAFLGYRATRPPAAPPIVAAAQPTNEREAWALALLARLGNDAPTADTVAFLEAWQAEENTTAQFNPLATSQDMPGATQFNSSHVKNYQSYADGIEATVRTFQYDYPGYADVLEGLRTNDPARALAGLTASPWAEEAGYGERIRALWQSAAQRATGARAEGAAYLLQGDVGTNVLAALSANGGALQRFTIPPGGTWSFGHSIAPISALGALAYVNGVYAGGWCDLSAEYLKVAQQLGLEVRYIQHANVSTPFPSIWLNEQGDGENGQDLLITNTTTSPITFRASVEGGALVIEGS
jgi:hypothetical protein